MTILHISLCQIFIASLPCSRQFQIKGKMPHHIVTTNNNLLTRLPKLIWEQASLQGADFFMGENIL